MSQVRKRRALSLAIGTIFLSLSGLGYYTSKELGRKLIATLQIASKLETIHLQLPTALYDAHGEKFAELGTIKRYYLPLQEINKDVQKAVIASEDREFFSHPGIDIKAMLRAFLRNVEEGGYHQGASTISQQLARSAFLKQEKTLERKLKEIILALYVEHQFSKEKILEFYLNSIYFGKGAYGIEAAARRYFAKSNKELNLSEISMLVGIIKAPSFLNPYKRPKLCDDARKRVLATMLEHTDIDISRYKEALRTKIKLAKDKSEDRRIFAHYTHFVAQELAKHVDNGRELGLKVYTNLDSELQRQSYAFLQASGNSEINGAAVALNPKNGALLALHGSRDYAKSSFNRAFFTERDLGGLGLPFLYGYAIDSSYHPLSNLYGQTTREGYLYRALLQMDWNYSRQLLRELGLEDVGETLGNMDLRIEPSVKAPYFSVYGTLKSMTAAYASLAQGELYPAFAIARIEDLDGKILYEHTRGKTSRALSPEGSYVLRKMLEKAQKVGYARTDAIFPPGVTFLPAASDDDRNLFGVALDPSLVIASYQGADRGEISLFSDRNAAYQALAQQFASFFKGRKVSQDVPPKAVTFARVPIGKRIDSLPFVKGQEPKRTSQLTW